jgi:hypothetical protein
MMFASNRHLDAAILLHRYLVTNHWTGHTLSGPDSGIRFNYRIGRFIKSALPRVQWSDSYYYLQGQGYWTLGNWCLFDLTGDETYRDIAVRTSASMLATQRGDGAWEYPNIEWSGRVATVEGTWGALGLLETYRRTGAAAVLTGVVEWHRFLTNTIGFQRVDDELAVNYFAHCCGARVPNNSAAVLRFLAELATISGNAAYLRPAAGLLRFLSSAQLPSGEFPYAVEGASDGTRRTHFQCYQYNAFQCLDLTRYFELTKNPDCLRMLAKVLGFLRTGVGWNGRAYYACGNRHRDVTYHAAALGAAFASAARLKLGAYDDLADRAFGYVVGRQRADGGFDFSRGDYHILRDRRSYPRYLAMILFHLLQHDAARTDAARGAADVLALVG